MDPTTIPDAMAQAHQWLCWDEQERDGKLTKVPRAPWKHSGNVSATDPANWTDLATAHDFADKLPAYGLGFAFAPDGPFVGIDLDDCVVAHDGQRRVLPSAQRIIDRCDSYTEVSPSGTGVHIIVRGEVDAVITNDAEGVEVYDADRFFTVTADHLPPTPATVTPAPEALAWLHDQFHDPAAADAPPAEDPYGCGPSGDADGDADGDGHGHGHGHGDGDTPVPGDGEAHPISDLTVRDVYPTRPHGENFAHPIHGSESTGANFKIYETHPAAVCWRHQHGPKVGCLLCAWHLLAMDHHNMRDCAAVRRRYVTDDALAFGAWVEAYRQDLVSGESPPWRAVRHIVTEHGLSDMRGGGTPAWAAYRAACRIIRADYDIPVVIEDEDEDSSASSAR